MGWLPSTAYFFYSINFFLYRTNFFLLRFLKAVKNEKHEDRFNDTCEKLFSHFFHKYIFIIFNISLIYQLILMFLKKYLNKSKE